jgi:flavin reductase (DIM6/NTAB) family NADH-FMN oxidoreductase RutF/DNA-binding IclR family transcriptional regulator
VLGCFPTGVVLVTARLESGEPIGMIVGSFASVSLDPPLVGYFPMKGSSTFSRMRNSGRFAVNILSAEHEALCRRFASRDHDKWAGVAWHESPGGSPVLDDAVAWLDCSTASVSEAGDHFVVMGEVLDLAIRNPALPLLFFQGAYGSFSTRGHQESAVDLVAAVSAAERAAGHIQRLARNTGLSCEAVTKSGGDLVVVAQAGDAPPRPVGTRYPFRYPFGALWAGHGMAADEDAWVTGAGPGDSAPAAAARARVQAIRENGWSRGIVPAGESAAFERYIDAYTRDRLPPAGLRELIERAGRWAATAPSSAPADTTPGPHVRELSVPVRGDDGAIALIVTLTDLPERVSDRQFNDWLRQLSECALAIEGARWASAA